MGRDGGERIVRCIGGPACIAKNRYDLPAELLTGLECPGRGPFSTSQPNQPIPEPSRLEKYTMADLRGFDATQVEPSTPFDPIPAGNIWR